MYGNSVGQAMANVNMAAPAYLGDPNNGRTIIADGFLRELNVLIEKALMISQRQSSLRDRLFGSRPVEPTSSDKSPSNDGFVNEANTKLITLQNLLDKITANCSELEIIA